MEKCSHYYENKKLVGWCNSNQPIYSSTYRCDSTRELYECSCGGVRAKCDFYPKVREEASIDKNIFGVPISYSDLSDWYISSVNQDDSPVWTEEHIEELFNDFYLIPKEAE